MSDFRLSSGSGDGTVVDVTVVDGTAIETSTVVPAIGGLDEEARHRAVRSRDARFDGTFYFGVTTTNIYCRPSCPAVPAKPDNIRFFPTPATAQAHGFRACKRCRPDATPGSPEWNVREDLAARAMRLIGDGVVDREGVTGLANRLGYSERHVHRQLTAELGAGPLALARAQRAHTARILLETTELSVSAIAFAAGFASIRQFNDTMREIFDAAPSQLRQRRARTGRSVPGFVNLRLAVRAPFAAEPLFGFLAAEAVPGLESGDTTSYRRALGLPHGTGTVELSTGHVARGWVDCRLRLSDQRDLTAAVQRARRLLDLDLDPVAVAEHLAADPLLAPLVAERPGLRSPGHVDPEELAIRAVLTDGLPPDVARETVATFVTAHGIPLPQPADGLTHVFPRAATLAFLNPAQLTVSPDRITPLITLLRAITDGSVALHPGADRAQAAAQLSALGLRGSTIATIRMRALGDPDVLPPVDSALRIGWPRELATEPDLAARTASWRPWRSYATHLLRHNR